MSFDGWNHMTTRPSLSDEIRSEADRILASGLLALLVRYGEAHVVGSYTLGLMTWRDLDIHLVQESLDVKAFFRACNKTSEA
jgi:hypothetical protein